MRFPSLTTCAVAVLHALSAAALICPDGLCTELMTRATITAAQVSKELGPQLSTSAQIFGPSDPRWANATERFQTYKPPNITVVVEPGHEDDIPTIVCRYVVTLFSVRWHKASMSVY